MKKTSLISLVIMEMKITLRYHYCPHVNMADINKTRYQRPERGTSPILVVDEM